MDKPIEKKKKKRKEEEEAVASWRHPCFIIVFFLFSFFSVFFPYKWCFGLVSIYRPKQPDFADTTSTRPVRLVFFPVWNKGLSIPVHWPERYIPAVLASTVRNWLPWPWVMVLWVRDLPLVWLPQIPSCNSSRINSNASGCMHNRYGPEKDRLYNFWSSDSQNRGAFQHIF